jgi:hypothetical protein
MFNIAQTRHFTRTITTVDGQSFKATFKVLADDEIKQHELGTAEGEEAFIRAVVTDVQDVLGAEGKPMPFSEALLFEMLAYADIKLGFMKAYREGRAEVRTGN